MTQEHQGPYRYVAEHLKPLSGTVLQLRLVPCDAVLSYDAGQYLEIELPDGHRAAFSIANAPLLDGQHISLHVRHTAETPFSDALVAVCQQRQPVLLHGPFGQSRYSALHGSSILVAGGTGFAPMKALIEQALFAGMPHPMHLFWGAKTANDLYQHELPRHWADTVPNFSYTPVLSEPKSPQTWSGEQGWVDACVAKYYPDLQSHQVVLAGPPDMVNQAYARFQALGLTRARTLSDWLDIQEAESSS